MEQALSNTRPVIHIQGRERVDVGDALDNIVVNQPINGMSHMELTLTNWGVPENADRVDFPYLDIALGDPVEVYIGEQESTKIFDGEITAIEEQYGDGAPQLVLLAQDRLHHLARQRYSRSFEEQSPDDIVQAIAGEGGLRADVNVSTARSTYHQVNESNLAFLFRVLSRFDVAVRLDDGTLRARREEPDRSRIGLDAQDNALKVRLIADLNHQQTRTNVLGFNAANDSALSASANTIQPAASATSAADTLSALGWDGEDVMPQPFPQTQAESDAFAQAHFNRRARQFISGDIRCQGEPQLRSGREIELEGVSPRLQGVYQVVHCVHRFDGITGYETHLKVHRPDWQV
jgi:phage protein D